MQYEIHKGILHPIIHCAVILLRNLHFPIISPGYQTLSYTISQNVNTDESSSDTILNLYYKNYDEWGHYRSFLKSNVFFLMVDFLYFKLHNFTDI